MGRASGQSRDVCAPACRWAAHATERGPVAPPVAFSALPTPPIAASGRQPPLTRGRRPLAAKRVERAGRVARCLRTRVPMGGTRNRERPCHAASSVPHSPRHQLPPQGVSHLLHAAGALSRQKGRASGQSRDVPAPLGVRRLYALYPVPRRTRFDNQNLPQNLRPPLEIC